MGSQGSGLGRQVGGFWIRQPGAVLTTPFSSGCTFGQPQPESTTTPFCQTDTPPVPSGESKHWVSDILIIGDIAYVTGKFNTLTDADGSDSCTRNGLGACDLTQEGQ